MAAGIAERGLYHLQQRHPPRLCLANPTLGPSCSLTSPEVHPELPCLCAATLKPHGLTCVLGFQGLADMEPSDVFVFIPPFKSSFTT